MTRRTSHRLPPRKGIEMDALVLIGSFMLLMVIGTPIAYSLGLAALIGALWIELPLDAVMIQIAPGVNKLSLLAIPFFVLAGAIMAEGGMARRLVDFAGVLVGFVRGGLSLVNIMVSTFFGAISASSVADTASIGSVLIPEMVRKGCRRNFATAVTLSGSVQAILIPPSHNAVLYSLAAGGTVSIAALFMAGVLPGLLMGLTLAILCLIKARQHNYPRDQIPGAVRSAFRAMTAGHPGAAHLRLPYDVQKQAVHPAEVWAQPGHDRFPALRSAPEPAAVDEAADRLVAARAPVFICGGGVIIAGTCEALAALAQALNAPVCSTVRGVAILHIDVDAMTIATNYRTDVALVGDALLALTALHHAVLARPGRRPADAVDGRALVARARRDNQAFFAPLAASLDKPIRPERVVDALNRLLPARAVVVADLGTPCPYLAAYFNAPQSGRHFITNRAHGALGHSMSAGVGALFGRPDAVVVSALVDELSQELQDSAVPVSQWVG